VNEHAAASRSARAVEVLAGAGLTLLEPADRMADEVRCLCVHCGLERRVRPVNVAKPGGVACRWCHGWAKWGPWGDATRAQTIWRAVRGPEFVLGQLSAMGLMPLTAVGDEFTAVGVQCGTCGDTTVVMPERIDADKGWGGCAVCFETRRRQVRLDADAVFAANGLTLHGPCRGEFTAQLVTCDRCTTQRRVRYADLVAGTAPLCWACTHGIAPDEPHRVYLFRFAALGVMKVGLTHARHDRRLGEHTFEGGDLVEIVEVPDRAAARRLEAAVLQRYRPWRTPLVGPLEFPQGGWTEAWADTPGAPPCSLTGALASLNADP
jgi:hypothetical protein